MTLVKTFWTALLALCLVWIPSLACAAGRGGALDFSFEGMVRILIYVIIAGCIIGLLYYLLVILIGPRLGEPLSGWIRIIFIAIVVIFLIFFLLNLLGRI